MRTETSASQKFADSILALRPRVAVFDCDGTLWSGDSGADFFYWQIDRGMFPHGVAERAAARYADYNQGKVDETEMSGDPLRPRSHLVRRGLLVLEAPTPMLQPP